MRVLCGYVQCDYCNVAPCQCQQCQSMRPPLTPRLYKFANCPSLSLFQDHPGLRGTPLAMLAAQCNKLQSKSPPPLADAAVGKGFHPWKKSVSGQSSVSPAEATSRPSSAQSASPAQQHTPYNTVAPSPQPTYCKYNLLFSGVR